MYQIEAWSALRKAEREVDGVSARRSVAANVWALGFTSLLTDVSSEMVSTVLPIYLVLYLGLTPFHFGMVDGFYHGVTALLRLVSGVAADRSGRHKELAAAGYGVSAASRLGLVAAGASWPLIATVVALDRAAKGARTVPRDALISLSSRPENLATSFGVHRALDSAGAMLGPLVALAILVALPNAFDVVFVSSFSVALCGLSVLLLFVRNVKRPLAAAAVPVTPSRVARRVLEAPGMPRLVVAATALSAATVSDGFVYLLLQRGVGFNAGLFPLLYVGTAAAYLLLAVPVGRLADRVGRHRTFLWGYAPLGVVYVLSARPGIGTLGVVACLLLLGSYYAFTDGVLMALVSGSLEADRRGSGMAFLSTFTSLARWLAAVLFGALWSLFGQGIAVLVFVAALAAAMVLTAVLLRGDTFARAADGSG